MSIPPIAGMIGGFEVFKMTVFIWVVTIPYIIYYRLKYSDKAIAKRKARHAEERRLKMEHVKKVQAQRGGRRR